MVTLAVVVFVRPGGCAAEHALGLPNLARGRKGRSEKNEAETEPRQAGAVFAGTKRFRALDEPGKNDNHIRLRGSAIRPRPWFVRFFAERAASQPGILTKIFRRGRGGNLFKKGFP